MFHNQGKNLLIKALETGSILLQTPSTDRGKQKEYIQSDKILHTVLSDAEIENDVLDTDKYQQICDY